MLQPISYHTFLITLIQRWALGNKRVFNYIKKSPQIFVLQRFIKKKKNASTFLHFTRFVMAYLDKKSPYEKKKSREPNEPHFAHRCSKLLEKNSFAIIMLHSNI
jgi:hypothetical protein